MRLIFFSLLGRNIMALTHFVKLGEGSMRSRMFSPLIFLSRLSWHPAHSSLYVQQVIEASILQSGYSLVHGPINQPSTMYATHKVIRKLNNLNNYNYFLFLSFEIECQPHVLLFFDLTSLTHHVAFHLMSFLPPYFQDQGIILHYYSLMSDKYLMHAHEQFTKLDRKCQAPVPVEAVTVIKSFWVMC